MAAPSEVTPKSVSPETGGAVEHTPGYAVFNPHDKPVCDLPVIYGFNNGGSPGLLHAVLLSEDGHCLGGHVCSSENFMLNDLGILEGSRSDRHQTFKEHYPDGYRMDFVPAAKVMRHDGLTAAYEKNAALAKARGGAS